MVQREQMSMCLLGPFADPKMQLDPKWQADPQ
jgi:hypothetical protein